MSLSMLFCTFLYSSSSTLPHQQHSSHIENATLQAAACSGSVTLCVYLPYSYWVPLGIIPVGIGDELPEVLVVGVVWVDSRGTDGFFDLEPLKNGLSCALSREWCFLIWIVCPQVILLLSIAISMTGFEVISNLLLPSSYEYARHTLSS